MITNLQFPSSKTFVITLSALLLSACGSGGGAFKPDFSPRPISKLTNRGENSVYAEASNTDRAEYRKGKGAHLIVSDDGLDKSHPFIANTPNYIDDEMYMIGGEKVQPHELKSGEGEIAHGTDMVITAMAEAPEARITAAQYYSSPEVYAKENVSSKNMMIFSNSYAATGKQSAERVAAESQIVRLRTSVENGNALHLYASGNEGSAVTSYAAAPYFRKELKPGFIGVTAYDTDKNEKTQLPCGEMAKDICLTAPENFLTKRKKGDDYVTYGTSNSTAYTAGVAATISARYDWMRNYNLQDVLFTTATDMGAPGVDAVWGHGLINSDKARNGYGRFDRAGVELKVEGKRDIYFFDNDISGTGGFIKSGSKTLVLNGDNTFTGKSEVREGSLVLNGKNVAQMTVSKGAKLVAGDAADVSVGNLYSNGVLRNTDGSTLNVNGELALGSGSKVEQTVGSKIAVSKGLTIGNDVELDLLGVTKGYVTAAGKKETLFSAEKITGKIARLNNKSELVESKLNQSANEISVTMKRDSVGDYLARIENAHAAKAVKREDVKVLDKVLNNIEKKAEKKTETKPEKVADKKPGEKDSKNGFYEKNSGVATLSPVPSSANVEAEEAMYADVVFASNQADLLAAIEANGVSKHLEDTRYVETALSDKSRQSVRNAMFADKENSWLNYGASRADSNARQSQWLQGGASSTIGKGKAFVSLFGERFNLSQRDMNSAGFSFGYIKPVNGISLYGYNSNSFFTRGFNGEVGFGGYKAFALNNKLTVAPEVGVAYNYARMREETGANAKLKNYQSNNVLLNAGLTAQYRVNDKFTLNGTVGLTANVHSKQKFDAVYFGENYRSDAEKRQKTKAEISFGANYQLSDKSTFGLGYGYNNTEKAHKLNAVYRFGK